MNSQIRALWIAVVCPKCGSLVEYTATRYRCGYCDFSWLLGKKP